MKKKLQELKQDLKIRAYRSRKYLDYIRSIPCLHCNGPAEPHHLRELGDGGMALKPPDTQCVPLCREGHDEWGTRVPEWIDIKMIVIRLQTEFIKRILDK